MVAKAETMLNLLLEVAYATTFFVEMKRKILDLRNIDINCKFCDHVSVKPVAWIHVTQCDKLVLLVIGD